MDLRDLEVVTLVAERGSLTAAAAALRLSQPSVSTRIGNLERGLGARLFDRDSTGAHLTAAGERFLPYARRIRALLEEATAAAASASRPIAVGVAASFVDLAAPAVAAAADRLDCSITIQVAHGDQLRVSLLDQTLDLALTSGTDTPSGLSSTHCVTTRLVAVARPDIEPAPDARYALHAWDALHDEASDELLARGVRTDRVTRVSPSSAAIALAIDSGYIGIVPGVCALKSLETGQLRPLDLNLGRTPLDLVWIHRYDATAVVAGLIAAATGTIATA